MSRSKLVAVYRGNYLQAQIVKGHLDCEGIPALLQYEAAGLVYGVTVNGLGETRVMVPEGMAADAEAIIAGSGAAGAEEDGECDEASAPAEGSLPSEVSLSSEDADRGPGRQPGGPA